MSSSPQNGRPASAHAILLTALILLGTVPPETRGHALAGCALLFALLALVRCGRPDAARVAPLMLIPLGAFPYLLTAQAPGSAVGPLALAFLAGWAGLAASGLPGDLRARRALPVAISCVGAAVALYGLYQVLGGLDALSRALEGGLPVADHEVILARAGGGRAFALFATPAALGGYLALVLPVTVAEALSRRGWMRGLLLALAAAEVAGLVAAASATATAALLLVLLVALLRRVGSVRRAALGVGVVSIVLLAVIAQRGSGVTDLSDANSPWRLRAGNLRIASAMIADRPWLGVGPGGYGEVYPAYRQPGDNESQHVHNLPLELVASLGLPVGLLASGLFYFYFLGPLLRRRSPAPAWWNGLEIGLAAFALHNLADFTAFLPSLLWSAAILRGWIARPAEPTGRLPRWVPAALFVCVLAGSAVALLGGLAATARGGSRQAVVEGEGERAASLARRAVRLAPWEVDGWLLFAQADLARDPTSLPALELARERLDRAVRLSPVRPAARALRARVRAALGDTPGAYADAVEAARRYPLKGEYRELRDGLAAAAPRPPVPSP